MSEGNAIRVIENQPEAAAIEIPHDVGRDHASPWAQSPSHRRCPRDRCRLTTAQSVGNAGCPAALKPQSTIKNARDSDAQRGFDVLRLARFDFKDGNTTPAPGAESGAITSQFRKIAARPA